MRRGHATSYTRNTNIEIQMVKQEILFLAIHVLRKWTEVHVSVNLQFTVISQRARWDGPEALAVLIPVPVPWALYILSQDREM